MVRISPAGSSKDHQVHIISQKKTTILRMRYQFLNINLFQHLRTTRTSRYVNDSTRNSALKKILYLNIHFDLGVPGEKGEAGPIGPPGRDGEKGVRGKRGKRVSYQSSFISIGTKTWIGAIGFCYICNGVVFFFNVFHLFFYSSLYHK